MAFATTAIYAGTRSFAYRLYRRANEEAVIYAASENSHFLESLRGMASIKALAIGDRRQGIWNNYLVDRIGAELGVDLCPPRPHRAATMIIVPVVEITRLTEATLGTALSMGRDDFAVHVVPPVRPTDMPSVTIVAAACAILRFSS